VALVKRAFFDTTVLVAGLIDMGSVSVAAQCVMTAIAEQRVRKAATAWHCCLEFYSVSTRLPLELRLAPADAAHLLREEVLGRFEVLDLPAAERSRLVERAAADTVSGGRVYDLHIAEVARVNGAEVVVTDNRRHFGSLMRHRIRVLSTAEFAAELGLGQ
jgi:predicted nucleic acid-binding protein